MKLIIVCQRISIIDMSMGQNDVSQQLSKDTQEIITTVQNAHTAQSKNLKQHFEDLSSFQKQQFEQLRAYFVQKDPEMRKARVQIHLLESLWFMEMNHRYETIAPAHYQTFRWIFKDPQCLGKPWDNFSDWLSTSAGVYWIQGKAGSGKSTLLRFVWDSQETWECLKTWAASRQLVAGAFYFWNSGVEVQRSRTGFLRTLLYELLNKQKDLIPEVLDKEWERQSTYAAHDMELTPESWSLNRLKTAFSQLVGLSNENLRLCFFVDGLDEYEGPAGDIAEYICDLAQRSRFAKFCVSSRPWPAFESIFHACLGLKLQHLTEDDIKAYVTDTLGNNRHMRMLRAEDPDNTTALINEVVEKASGVFLWVELVVKSLISGLRDGDEVSHLRHRLALLPPDLEKLYEHMLSQIEPEYKQESSTIFQIFRANGYSLGIPTLYRALSYPTYQSVLNIDYSAAENSVGTRKQMMEAKVQRMQIRLNSRSKGILEAHASHNKDDEMPSMESLPTVTHIIHRGDWHNINARKFERQTKPPNNFQNAFQTTSVNEGHEFLNHSKSIESRVETRIQICNPQAVFSPRPNLHSNSDEHDRNWAATGYRNETMGEKYLLTTHIGQSSSKSSWPQRAPYVTYLHRTARDYLEQELVWKRLLDETRSTDFNPHLALLRAHIAEIKTIPFPTCITAHGSMGMWDNFNYNYESISNLFSGMPEIGCICRVGLILFAFLTNLDIPAPSLEADSLLEELDRILTLRLAHATSDREQEHWSHCCARPYSEETQQLRRHWARDTLAVAVKTHVMWYMKGKLREIADSGFDAEQRGPPLPLGQAAQRPGLPPLAYALCLDCFGTANGQLVPDVSMVKKLLEEGQKPGTNYRGYTVWEYTIHCFHIVGMMNISLSQSTSWCDVFRLFLSYGADPHAHCVHDTDAFAQALALKEDGPLSRKDPLVASHFVRSCNPYPYSAAKPNAIPAGDTYRPASSLPITAGKYPGKGSPRNADPHSVSAIVHNAFALNDIPGAEQLVELLEEKKRIHN